MVVVAMGMVEGLFSPSVAAVGQSWIARWTVLARLRFYRCCLKGLCLSQVLDEYHYLLVTLLALVLEREK